jgi:hypothetical protein
MENPTPTIDVLLPEDKAIARKLYDFWVLGGYSTEYLSEKYDIDHDRVILMIRFAHIVFRRAMKDMKNLKTDYENLEYERNNYAELYDGCKHRLVKAEKEIDEMKKKLHKVMSDNNDINPVLLKSIYDFEFSVRTYNCLKNDNMCLLGDVVIKSESDLLRIPNLGRRSLNEIKQVVEQNGVWLGMQIPEWEEYKSNIELYDDNFEFKSKEKLVKYANQHINSDIFNERERIALTHNLGLTIGDVSYEPKSYSAISNLIPNENTGEYNLSSTRIRQIVLKAIRKLKRKVKSNDEA